MIEYKYNFKMKAMGQRTLLIPPDMSHIYRTG